MAYPMAGSNTSLPFLTQQFKDTSCLDYIVVKQKQKDKIHALDDADNYYIQGWFSRVSWKKKQQFIIRILHSIDDPFALNNLIMSLEMINKDLIYSRDLINTKFVYDIPNDHDRSLDDSLLTKVMKDDEEWLISLDTSERWKIILDLIRMSGSALALKVLKQAKVLKDRCEFIEYLKNRFINDENKKSNNDVINSVSKNYYMNKSLLNDISKNLNIKPLLNMYNVCSNIEPNLIDKPKMRNLLNDVEQLEKLWESNFKMLLDTANGKFRNETNMKITKSALKVDKLQLLPLNVIRQILSYLDDKSKLALSKVDKFWYHSVNAKKKEQEARKYVNNAIRSIDETLLKTNLPGKYYTARISTIKRPKSAGRSTTNKKKFHKKPLSANTVIQDDLPEPIFSLMKRHPMSKNPFRGKYNSFIIETHSMYDRSIDCNRKWIAATENTSIVFYNLITGLKSNFTLDGHTLVITCLVFFPNSNRIATASLDKTIRTWDIWHKILLDTFTGHTDVILSITVNEQYLVSCSRDTTVRVLSLKINTTLFVLKEATLIPTKVLVTNTNYLYIVSTQGSLLKFSLNNRTVCNEIDAHTGCIIFLSNYGPLIITSGEDLYVRIWNANLIKEKCLVEIYHMKKVNSAVISYSTLITGCNDGFARFWDLGTRKLFREIVINYFLLPIISIKMQSYYNHIKIFCNNEANIYIVQFPLKSVKLTKKANPYQAIMLNPILKTDHTSAKKKRLRKLNYNKCSSLPLLNKFSKVTTDSIFLKSVYEPRFIEQFPGYTGEPEYDKFEPEVGLIQKVGDTLNEHKSSKLIDISLEYYK